MNAFEELFDISKRLAAAADLGDALDVVDPLKAIQDSAREVRRSFSGSWLGYHAFIYYANLQPAPPGAHFSQEWGLDRAFSQGTRGDWREFKSEEVKQFILSEAGTPELSTARAAEANASKVFNHLKSELLSIMANELSGGADAFLEKLSARVGELETMSLMDVVEAWRPKKQIMTRDTLALGQGTKLPPHVEISADAAALVHTFAICREASDIAGKAASHLERKERRTTKAARIGTNVFIGHGRSPAWRELKDFVQDRLGLPWDEFNRVPVAGVTNTARLSEMLDAAAVAFLVMTADDETADGELRARENVVHEAGLFQGRLGFTRAIVLIEEGCSEFSNIHGLGQIRFGKGNMASAFEEVRRVVERELEGKD